MDPYEICPEYETESFKLRLVNRSDAKDLLVCYSDPAAAARANGDSCASGFYFTSLEEMEECIDFWLREYEERRYVRFSIIPKLTGHAVGTLEIFGGEWGVLRIDLADRYETEHHIEELIKLTVLNLISDFKADSLKIKVLNTPVRVNVLERYGFVPSETFRPGMGYYERTKQAFFDKSKGLAYCGLACCVCSGNAECAGCRNAGCTNKEWCKAFRCCREKGIAGCWECSGYPCDYGMLKKPRIRAFAGLIEAYGEEALIEALGNGEAKGRLYHYKDKLIGDYDWMAEDGEALLCRIMKIGHVND